MKTQSKWIYVLIGNDRTGKTCFQKQLVKLLAHQDYDRLHCNLSFPIKHPHLIRKIETLSIGNRSIQEKLEIYKTVDDYFQNHFKNADICVVSTHLSEADARSIITNGQKKFYNVCAVFFSNSIEKQRQQNEEISVLNWDDRWVVANQTTEDEAQQMTQLNKAAESFVQILIERTRGW